MTDVPTRIAVIGAGPAGFYAAGHLLKASEQFEVDMIERLPTPWGLVRSGVAPDHPKIKSVTRVYEKTAAHPRFRFFGNVHFGEHVSREDLLEHYHAILYATGSPVDRPLGIPGEDLPGSHAATEFVGWYNGHPDHTDLEVDLLSADRAVVIGNGNVALDVARMLVLAPSELAPTDTADHALEVLARSRVSEIVVIGRRGPAQAAFTNPELLELGELADADVIVDPDELDRALAVSDPDAEANTISRRNVEILRSYADRPATGQPKRIVLRFLLSPTALLADEHGRLGAVELVHNELVPAPGGGLRAQPTDRRETIPAELAFRAIGYRGVPLPGVPFDERTGVIPSDAGRIIDPSTGSPPLRRIRRRMDQAGPLRRDRHEQARRPGDGRRDARRSRTARRRRRSIARARVHPRPRIPRCGIGGGAHPHTPARPRHIRGLGSHRSPRANPRRARRPAARQAHPDRGHAPYRRLRRALRGLIGAESRSIRSIPSATLSPAGPVSSSGRAPDF